mmetsp:Transcript_6509/g.15893  ORF Transcript_6509/g.15893 Transcript_6509/m.15893 type:complete len:88 (+) Transcript_6509:77-340(+)
MAVQKIGVLLILVFVSSALTGCEKWRLTDPPEIKRCKATCGVTISKDPTCFSWWREWHPFHHAGWYCGDVYRACKKECADPECKKAQ